MLEELHQKIQNCRDCEAQFGFTPHPIVFGNEDSKIVQISQAPSNHVYQTGKPFTDMSGKTLKEDWYQISEEIFYNPNYFYITSLSHCYPGKDSKGNDKTPPMHCFQKWITKELEVVKNELYIIIGAKAAKKFFPNIPFEELVFHNQEWNHKTTIVLPHPSPLNKKWLKDHPDFEEKRLKEIRNILYRVLNHKKGR